MSARGMPVPAPLALRYAAWSLDAAVIALLVIALLHGFLGRALAACRNALDALTTAMAGTLPAAVEAGGSPLVLVQIWLGDGALHAAALALAGSVTGLVALPTLVFALLSLPWFAAFEGSARQATPGKRLLGLRVIDDDGMAPGPARAALRQAAGALSWLSLNIGHALAGLPPRHQALHDRIAGTRVVRIDARPVPLLARMWLALQLPAAFLLLALLMRAVDRSLGAAMDAALLG